MNQKNAFWLVISGFAIVVALLLMGNTKPLMAGLGEFLNAELLFIVANVLITTLGISNFRKGYFKENRVRLLILFTMALFLDLFYGLYHKDFAFATLPLFGIAHDLFTMNKRRLVDSENK